MDYHDTARKEKGDRNALERRDIERDVFGALDSGDTVDRGLICADSVTTIVKFVKQGVACLAILILNMNKMEQEKNGKYRVKFELDSMNGLLGV